MSMKDLLHRDVSRGFLVLVLVLAGIIAPASAASPPVVKAVVEKSAVRLGATVTVTVRIKRARNVGSVPFTLLYDPAILEFVSSTSHEGGFLGQNRATTTFLAQPGPLSRGGGIVVGLSRLDPEHGAGGEGVLCRLTFKAIAPGQSSLTFNRAVLLDPRAQPLAAGFTGTTIRVRPAP